MRYRFGDFEVDSARFVLLRRGRLVRIQPKALQLLIRLLEHHPAVQSKDALLDALWPDTTVTEGSLTRAMGELRRALRDRAGATSSIRTVRGRGYGLAVEVDCIADDDTGDRQAGRRRLAAVLNADAAGYSRLMADDEAATVEQLQASRAHFDRGIRDHRGRLVNTVGDSVLAEFPTAQEAVQAALAIQSELARTNADRPAHRVMAFRMGIHLGDVRDEGDGVYGHGVNVAARLQALAHPGGIALSDAVHAQVAGSLTLTCEDLGEQRLKNIPETVRVHRTLPGGRVPESATVRTGMATGAPLAPVMAEAARTPAVGRVREREALSRAFGEARAGERRLVLVAGEPGIGKTRLAADLAVEAAEAGSAVLYGRCDEDSQAFYQPFAEAIDHYARGCPDEVLDRILREAGSEVVRIVPGLARRFPAHAPPEPGDGDLAAERDRLFEAIDRLLSSLAAPASLVLVIDDLHWADDSSVALLRYLGRSSRPAALLIAGTYRDTDLGRKSRLAEALADLRREPAVLRLRLTGLEEAEMGELASVWTAQSVPAEFARWLNAETAGNPFFAEELLIHLADSVEGRDHLGAAGAGTLWTANRIPETTGLPEGIREVVGRRLARLPESTVEMLRAAALLGGEFEASIVARACTLPIDPVLEGLDEACRAQIVSAQGPGSGRFAFRHALIRKTLADEAGIGERTRLHWRIAEVLEERVGAGAAESLSTLAHHAAMGALVGDPLRAATWSVRAGHRAMELLAHQDALPHFVRALDLLDRGGIAAPELRFETHLAAGTAAQALADQTPMDAHFFAAIALARTHAWPERQAQAVLRFTALHSYVGQSETRRIAVIDEVLTAMGAEDSIERARLLARRAILKRFRAAETPSATIGVEVGPGAEADADEAVAVARRLGIPEEVRRAAWAKGFLQLGAAGGDPKPEEEEALLALAEELGEPHLLAFTRRQLALQALRSGDRDRIEAALAAFGRLADRVRSRAMHAYLHCWRGALALAEGRFPDAKALGARAREEAPFLGLFHVGIVMAARLEEGRELRAIQGLEPSSGTLPMSLQSFRAVLANALARVGRTEEARRHLQELADDDWDTSRARWNLPLALRHLAEACALLEAREYADRLRILLDPYQGSFLVAFGGISIECSADRALGQLMALGGDLDRAMQSLERARRMEARLEAPALAARSTYWLARTLLVRGAPGDSERGKELARSCQEAAGRLGMARLEQEAVALR